MYHIKYYDLKAVEKYSYWAWYMPVCCIARSMGIENAIYWQKKAWVSINFTAGYFQKRERVRKPDVECYIFFNCSCQVLKFIVLTMWYDAEFYVQNLVGKSFASESYYYKLIMYQKKVMFENSNNLNDMRDNHKIWIELKDWDFFYFSTILLISQAFKKQVLKVL